MIRSHPLEILSLDLICIRVEVVNLFQELSYFKIFNYLVIYHYLFGYIIKLLHLA